MIKKPMKAPSNGATIEELQTMLDKGAIACSAKLDGIRGIITDKGILSNSLKPLGNEFVQKELNCKKLIGLDGELVVGLPYNDPDNPEDDVFNRTSGAIRRSSGEPDFKFYVFDSFINKEKSYQERWIQYKKTCQINHPRLVILEQRICKTLQEALDFEAELLEQGYEGMMPRSLSAPYKEGRATTKECYILKRKPLEQREAKIIGVFEQMENRNEKFTNELGNSTRSSHQENKVSKDTLGGFILHDELFGEFRCGTFKGGTKEWRKDIWEQYKSDPCQILGNYVTYTYQGVGSIDKPRQPRAKAEFRMFKDMTDY